MDGNMFQNREYLRRYYAGHVIADLPEKFWDSLREVKGEERDLLLRHCAQWAFDLADAMVEQAFAGRTPTVGAV